MATITDIEGITYVDIPFTIMAIFLDLKPSVWTFA